MFSLVYLFLHLSYAQTFYLGAHLGATDASGPQTPKEVQTSFGGRLGWLFYDEVGLGVFAHYYQANQVGQSTGYFPLLAEITFHPFRKPLEDTSLWVSAMFGTTKIFYDWGVEQGTNNQTTFGIAGGYSVFLEPRYSLGPEFQYLFIFDDETYALWSAVINLKIWF